MKMFDHISSYLKKVRECIRNNCNVQFKLTFLCLIIAQCESSKFMKSFGGNISTPFYSLAY